MQTQKNRKNIKSDFKKNHDFVNAENKSRLFQVIFLKSKIFLKYSRAFMAGV